MSILTFFNDLFANDNEPYLSAKSQIVGLKNKLNEMIVVFPDITISEMVFIKNKWETLPIKLGKGVSILGLDINNDYKLLITRFSENSYLETHEHTNNFEMNKVISGSVFDSINNKTYNTGDVFIIDRNLKHNLSSNVESFLLTIFSISKNNLVIPENIEEKLYQYC